MLKSLSKGGIPSHVLFQSLIFNGTVGIVFLFSLVKVLFPEFFPSTGIMSLKFFLFFMTGLMVPYILSSQTMIGLIVSNYKRLNRLKLEARGSLSSSKLEGKALDENVRSQVECTMKVYAGIINILTTVIFIIGLWIIYTLAVTPDVFGNYPGDYYLEHLVSIIIIYYVIRGNIYLFCKYLKSDLEYDYYEDR